MNKLLISKNKNLKKNNIKKPCKIKSDVPINNKFLLTDNYSYNINKSYITYINLEERTDRKNIFENFYKNQSFTPIRFNAIKTDFDEFTTKYSHLELNDNLKQIKNIKWVNGTLGCYDSHYSILLDNVNNTKDDFLVILEDDCTITSTSLNKCLQFLKENDDIDILRINCWKDIPVNPFEFNYTSTHSKYKNKNSTYFDGGTHCCLFLIKNIPNIIKYMNDEYVYQIDALYSTNKIKSVVYKINEKIKYKSISSIQQLGLDLKNKLDKKLYCKLLLRK